MSRRRLLLVAATLLVVALPFVYRTGMHGAALFNGDEAIYAEAAREMRASGRWSELTFDGEPMHPRPPGAVWLLAAAGTIGDAVGCPDPEPPLFWTLAITSALGVLLTMVLGARLFSLEVGVLGGALLGLSDLWAGYARTYESEPLLTALVLGAFASWATSSRLRWVGWGLCLGGALLVKQLVGFVPLGVLVVDAVARRPLRGAGMGVLLALAVALPWHVLEVVRWGHAFLDVYFVRSLLGRATTSLLHRTSPAYYLSSLVESEGWPFALLWIGGTVTALVVGLRRRERAPLLIGGWALGVLALYSSSRSRYDYYLLLAYPAFALAGAWLVAFAPARLRVLVAVALVVAAALTHLPRNLLPVRGDEATRALLQGRTAPTIYTFDRYPYTARLYGRGRVHVFVDHAADLPAAAALRATGMPAPALLASPPSRALELVERPALLVVPRTIELGALSRAVVVDEKSGLRLISLP